MNRLVKKEIRLLLPSWTASLLLALSIWLVPGDLDSKSIFANSLVIFPFLFCPVMLVMMTLSTFGREFSLGTFSMLLAQPVPRARIWWTKTLPLAVMAALVWFVWCISGMLHNPGHGSATDLRDTEIASGLFVLAMYSGGLWSVLLLRQVAAGFWFAVLIPTALLMTIAYLLDNQPDKVVQRVMIAAFIVYGIAGFWFARRLFLRTQDSQWTGGTIAMPKVRGLARLKAGSGARRIWRPRAALLIKELQLHQSQFLIAGVLALLHLGIIATRKLGHFPINSQLEFILENFWLLWLVMPMLVGCAAVAEERKIGTLEGQLGLPVRRRTQFAVRASSVLLLSLLFGVVMPLLLEGQRILPGVHFAPDGFSFESGVLQAMNTGQFFFWRSLGEINSLAPLLALLGMATAIGLIAFYASTLASNTLQALAPAVLGMLLTWFLLYAAVWPDINLPWQGWLIYFIGVPGLVATLLALACWNFKRVLIGWQVWWRNLLVLLVMLGLVVVVTTAIYHRAWEKLTPFEPPHGVARLSLSNPATLREPWNTLFVRLPDRRIWMDDYGLNVSAHNPLALVLSDIRMTSLGSGHLLGGSNWVNVIRGVWGQSAGIKTDGTLWVSRNPPQRELLANGGWKMRKAGDLVSFGKETNWSSLAPDGLSMLLVKNDGTLWRWGPTNWNYKNKKWSLLQSLTPQRLGTESNWAEVFLTDQQPCFLKTDGSVWTSWFNDSSNQQSEELAPGLSIIRSPLYEQGQWRSTTETWTGLQYHLGIRDDGTFRIWADEKLNKSTQTYDMTATDLQFGKGTNWLAVGGHGEKIATLGDDGTLWLWTFHHDYWRGWNPERHEQEMLATKPVRLGTHSDWIAIASADGGIITLAADGSLWYWPLESADYIARVAASHYGLPFDDTGDSDFEPLLDISRKPQSLGNVFSDMR